MPFEDNSSAVLAIRANEGRDIYHAVGTWDEMPWIRLNASEYLRKCVFHASALLQRGPHLGSLVILVVVLVQNLANIPSQVPGVLSENT